MAPDQGFSQTPDGAHSREPSEFSSKPTQHLRNLAVFIATPDSSLQSCCIVKDLSLSESDDDNEIMKGIDWKKFLDLIETDMKIRPKLGQIKGSISSPPQTCDNLRHLRAIISLAYAECLSRITFVVTLDIARPEADPVAPTVQPTVTIPKRSDYLPTSPINHQREKSLLHRRSKSDSTYVRDERPAKRSREKEFEFGHGSQSDIHGHLHSPTRNNSGDTQNPSLPPRASSRSPAPEITQTFSRVQIDPGPAPKEESKPSSPKHTAVQSPFNQPLPVESTGDHPQPPSSIENHQPNTSDLLSLQIVEEDQGGDDRCLLDSETIIASEDDKEEPDVSAQERNSKAIFASIDTSVLDRMNIPGKWQDFCQFFRLDLAKITSGTTYVVPGMIRAAMLYQLFGTFCMLEMETIQGGGWNADSMGLGKTTQAFTLIAISRCLHLLDRQIKEDRALGRTTRHLPAGTPKNPQAVDDVCPSQPKLKIQCPCQEYSIAARFQIHSGPNLLIVPPQLMKNWVDECEKNLDLKDTTFDWQFRTAHSLKLEEAKELEASDYEALMSKDLTADGDGKENSERYIILTTARCYQSRVRNKIGYMRQLPPVPYGKHGKVRAVPPEWTLYPLAWARAIRDEAHKEWNSGSLIINVFQNLPMRCCRWALTGTPFENGPKNMAWYVKALSKNWKNHKSLPGSWLERQRSDLSKCGFEKILELDKEFQRLVKSKALDEKEKKEHAGKMRVVLSQLWIQRGENSRILGDPLVPLPKHTVLTFKCFLTEEQAAYINNGTSKVDQIQNDEYKARLAKWTVGGRMGKRPSLEAKEWISGVRPYRMFCTLPGLSHFSKVGTGKWDLTSKEIRENKWIRTRRGSLYKLDSTDSFYEHEIDKITAHSSKIAHIRGQVEKVKASNSGMVICSMSPANALAIYWFLRKTMDVKVALISATMDSKTRALVIGLFQLDPIVLSDYPGDDPPQFLVSTTTLLGTGYNLTRARTIILTEPEWLLREQRQLEKRAHRVGQTQPTTFICMHVQNADIEVRIYEKQVKRDFLKRAAMQSRAGVDDDTQDEEALETLDAATAERRVFSIASRTSAN